jgi:hypothetical protein
VVLMGRPIAFATAETRYWLPVLPVLSCLNVYLVITVFRRQALPAAVFLFVFVAAYFTATESRSRVIERRWTERWATEIQPHLDERGITVAVFQFDRPPSPDWRDYELTARLSRDWPAEQRKRFWAIVPLARFDKYVSGVGWDRKLNHPTVSVSVRGLGVSGPIARLLWVRVRDDGTLEVAAATADHAPDSR